MPPNDGRSPRVSYQAVRPAVLTNYAIRTYLMVESAEPRDCGDTPDGHGDRSRSFQTGERFRRHGGRRLHLADPGAPAWPDHQAAGYARAIVGRSIRSDPSFGARVRAHHRIRRDHPRQQCLERFTGFHQRQFGHALDHLAELQSAELCVEFCALFCLFHLDAHDRPDERPPGNDGGVNLAQSCAQSPPTRWWSYPSARRNSMARTFRRGPISLPSTTWRGKPRHRRPPEFQ